MIAWIGGHFDQATWVDCCDEIRSFSTKPMNNKINPKDKQPNPLNNSIRAPTTPIKESQCVKNGD